MALAALSVAANGCDNGSDALMPGRTPAAEPSTGAEQAFARVLALALKQPEVRAMLHDAMQQSPFNEHKLVLQTFLNTRDGTRLVAAMAAAGGLDEGEVRSWAARLPPMDFYVPFVEHRRAWTGGDDVVVGANMDVDQSKFTGYTPAGGRLAFDAKAGTPRQTVIFLHPAEPKGIRPSSGPKTGGGRTIQDSSEPDGTVFSIPPDASQCELDEPCGGGTASAPTYLAEMGNFRNHHTQPDADPCELDEPCSAGGPITVPTYLAELGHFRNYTGDGVGGIELLVRHYAGGPNGPRIEDKLYDENMHWSWDGYYWDEVTTVNSLVKMALNTTTYIKVHERDSGSESWFGTDDYWGGGQFGGFGIRHRFYSYKDVEYINSGNSCYIRAACGADATVDITYWP